MAAISSFVPFGAIEAMAQEKGDSLENKDLKIGFIPFTGASPLVMADPLGFYKTQGLNVSVIKTAGWALIRDKLINREYDASHMLAPMPIAMSMGIGSAPIPLTVATSQNTNGQAITLHVKHRDTRDPKQWKGFKFPVPFEYLMHSFLLRDYFYFVRFLLDHLRSSCSRMNIVVIISSIHGVVDDNVNSNTAIT